MNWRTLLCCVLLFGCRAPANATNELLKTVADIPLTGGAYRFDYQSFDGESGRLYISHMRADELVVFDTRQNKVIATIPNLSLVTGVLHVPELKRVYASLAGSGEVSVIDAESLKELSRIQAGRFPDGLAFYEPRQKLYVSDEKGGQEIVIDAKTNKLLTTVALGGEVGNSMYDPKSQLIYVTIGSTNELAAINPETDKIERRFPLPGSSGPHGLYIDSGNQLAFVACEENDQLLVVDLLNRSVISNFSVGGDPDVLAFDTRLKRLYVASESGTVSIFIEKGRQLQKIGDVFIADSAHTISADSESHRIYLPLKSVHGVPVLRVMEPKSEGR